MEEEEAERVAGRIAGMKDSEEGERRGIRAVKGDKDGKGCKRINVRLVWRVEGSIEVKGGTQSVKKKILER